MKALLSIILLHAALAATVHADEVLFQDDFKGKLGEGWSWAREHRAAWRTTERGLEVRIEPGNQWGPQNDASNVLVRPAPDASKGEIEICATVQNRPTHQYEQVDLVWYYDDSNMVKLGEELVDGQLSVVMGREQRDKTRTLAIIPLDSASVRLQLLVKGNQIRGQFRAGNAKEWRDVGECDLPAPSEAEPKISLQFYQGPADAEHWAMVTDFLVKRTAK